MQFHGWTYWRWQLQRYGHGLGWTARISLLAVVAAALVGWLGLVPLKQETDQLRLTVQSAQRPGSAVHELPKQSSERELEQVQAFYAWLPAIHGDALEKVLASLQQAANANNLTLDQGEYRLATSTDSEVVGYDIQLPVKGSYPRIRHFMVQAQQDNPSLALTSISFSRQNAQEIGLDARVHWVLYLKQGRDSEVRP